MKPILQIATDPAELSQAAATEFVRQARETVQAKGSFTVSLSGGSTPKSLYALLAEDPSLRAAVPWSKVHFFWGDERHVPPDHPDSNYRMTHEAMLAKVPVPPANVHRINSEYPQASQAADEYEQTLREFFRLAAGQFPRFDLLLLGMGPDGHTASLFPGTAALHERTHLTVANWVDKFNAYRITLTLPVLNSAANIIFLISGEEKAETLRAVLHGEPERFPAQLICPTQGTLLWLVDRPAARLL
ncbi:MAG TPA: 6-phosphogluconolactonase [Candidatus Binatia bacterium]|jgi:6-phosphogluconolactonase|nr:6-phosphogluconolactonase [Candidatus Binatia bacterium]